jgi:NAD(P)-dependent dehydrogenase (short-subunit alcohol dehydrogenase family)
MSLKGKDVLVTGTGQGIGRAILRMGNDGENIAIVDFNKEKNQNKSRGYSVCLRSAATWRASSTRLLKFFLSSIRLM